MRFSPADADIHSMKVIELLIESGHYKAFRKEEVIKLIAKDANALAYALTETGKGDATQVQFEISSQSKSAPAELL